MSKLAVLSVLSAAILAVGVRAYSQTKPPAVYVDRGACPFECCTYRVWNTEKTTAAYARPDKRSKRLGEFKAGTRVRALTGEVRTVPSQFTVTKAHGKYKPGDVIWVYTPVGEGFYKVWFKGRMYQEELTYISGPFEQSFPKCEEAPDCWGKLDKEMAVEWWVKIRSADGWIGWTSEAENFGNKDACG